MSRTGSTTSNELIVGHLSRTAEKIEACTDADFVAYSGPLFDRTPDIFKSAIERLAEPRDRIVVWLETNGGLVEATERTAHIIRHHYRHVDFVVTTYAMSAGTVLVMSGDTITMDYSATLGPIDPQIHRDTGAGWVPALGYLEQYERLIQKADRGQLNSAELAFLIQKFDPGELYQFEQARGLSIALLEAWLARYKFKDWETTETRRNPVTEDDRRERAKNIATILNDTSRWHSHSRGISMEALRDINLQIDDIAERPELQELLSGFTSLFTDFNGKMGHEIFTICTRKSYFAQ